MSQEIVDLGASETEQPAPIQEAAASNSTAGPMNVSSLSKLRTKDTQTLLHSELALTTCFIQEADEEIYVSYCRSIPLI